MSDASIMNYEQTVNGTVRLMKSGTRAVLVEGPPGVGKTAMAPQIARALGVKHIFTIKLSHHDVPDVAGVPVPNEETKRTHFYASADMLPPEDLEGGLLMVHDEVSDQNISQQNLTCQIVFENRIHNYQFPPNTYHFLTGNRVQDRSGANRIVTKLGNRIANITVVPAPDELFDYGSKNGWNPTVLAFIKMHGGERINPNDNRENSPTYFNSFDPSDPQQMAKPQFASSRSYEFTSKYFNYLDANEPSLARGHVLGEVAALMGTPVASKLVAFRDIAMTMPDPDAILKGDKVPYPKKQEVLWALTLTLVSKVKKEQVKHLHKFLDNGPDEYLALAARLAFDTKVDALTGPDFHAMLRSPKLKAMFEGV